MSKKSLQTKGSHSVHISVNINFKFSKKKLICMNKIWLFMSKMFQNTHKDHQKYIGKKLIKSDTVKHISCQFNYQFIVNCLFQSKIWNENKSDKYFMGVLGENESCEEEVLLLNFDLK